MPTSPFNPARPLNWLPKLRPKAALETAAILKVCIGARAALAELKATGELIPNQAILINTIPLLEARASSEIENIVTTADQLFRFADEPGSQADPATKEALRYRTALHRGHQSLAKRPLSTATAIEVCATIRGIDVGIRKVPGTALTSLTAGTVIYTPPDGESRLRNLLANWERYLHEAVDVDPVIRMAVGHYQFEAIHPFADGNGRTGRVLNLLFLIVDAGIAKRQAASEYLKELCAVGVLEEVKAGREKLFINPRLVSLLTAESHRVPTFPGEKGSR
jgi:Fic family protein